MTRTTIIGGHGKIALRLAPLLVAAGHELTSWVRNPDHVADVEATGATAVVADVETMSTDEIRQRLVGQDAIVWSAGAGGGNPARTYAVDRDAAIRTMEAAVEAEAWRFVMVSYFYDHHDHGVPAESSFFPYADAKASADAHLRASDLDWTILGPSRLTDEPGTGRIETGEGVTKSSVSRDDVAAVISHVLGIAPTVGQTVDFNAGHTPIPEAI